MRIVVGELRNDLVTNSSIIGQTQQAISGQTILQLQFFNYLREPLTPTSVSVLNSELSPNAFRVVAEYSGHAIGRAGDENVTVQSRWYTEENLMKVTGSPVSNTNVINYVYSFQLTELATEAQTYTKFKYIQ